MVTGIANCFYDSTPCIFITGQVNSKFIRKDASVRQLGFQETDIVSIVRPITKFAVQCIDVSMFKLQLEMAIKACTEGRAGPVLLDIPHDVQRCAISI